MTKIKFERQAAEMKKRLTGATEVVPTTTLTGETSFSLTESAQELGVSYSTARRLLKDEPGVRRYSTTTTGASVIYPGTSLKRSQRVRMTFVVPESALIRVKERMSGEENV